MKTVETDDPLVQFLYILLRDHLTAGAVEEIMEKHIEGHGAGKCRLSNGFLAGHAKDLAARLARPK